MNNFDYKKEKMRQEIKQIPRVVDRKGQHYAQLVASIKKKYENN